MPRSVQLGVVVFAVAFAVVVATLAPVSGDALLGFDAYPLIAASRVDGAGALLGTFGEELMDGRYPDGRFYRPIVHLSFALDEAIGGLDPERYAWTDRILCAIAATLIGLLAMEFAGERGWARAGAGLGAALLYALHRSQLDVVPYAPRRAETLCILFLAATALFAARRAHPLLVSACALLAFLSKESGVIAIPIAFAAAASRAGGTPAKAAHATILPAAAVTLGVLLRTAVLGGVGGHIGSGSGPASTVVSTATNTWSALVAEVGGGAWAVAGLLAGVAGALATGARRRALGIGATWSLAALAVTFLASRFHDWYALPLVPGIALAAGVAIAGALDGKRLADRLGGLAAVALLGALATASLGSDQRETLRVAQRISRDQVERFERLVGPLEPGDEARFAPWVFVVSSSPTARPIFVHAPYSLSAFAELTLGRECVVAIAGDASVESDANAITVRLVPGDAPRSAIDGSH